MKKMITALVLMCTTLIGFADKYTPTEGWPYLYSDFVPAIVYYKGGKCESANINVHLLSNKLHFTDGENIMIVRNALQIDSVVCESGITLLYKGNKYVEKLAQSKYIVVGRTCEIDINSLNDSGGAYGISTTSAATQNVASFSDHGNMAAQRYNDMIADRHNNREICHANKSGINDILDKEQRKAFKAFLKANKIKWKESESLLLVAQYLDTIIYLEE